MILESTTNKKLCGQALLELLLITTPIALGSYLFLAMESAMNAHMKSLQTAHLIMLAKDKPQLSGNKLFDKQSHDYEVKNRSLPLLALGLTKKSLDVHSRIPNKWAFNDRATVRLAYIERADRHKTMLVAYLASVSLFDGGFSVSQFGDLASFLKKP